MAPVTTSFLAFHLPLIEEDDIQAVLEVLGSGWITTGPKAMKFEQAFTRYIGCSHAVAVNSGTAALHLALDAIGLRRGDEVVLPTLTFAATGEAVLYSHARPVLVDSIPGTFNLNPALLERAITSRTKAILPVHFGGHPCQMDHIREIAAHYHLAVIEDAAHALPAIYRGQMVGTIGDITCFSFYATKTITTGEGGMATSANPEFANRMRIMRLHGISKDAWKRYTAEGSWRYEILAPGFKYNLTDLQAALGLSQLAKCDWMWQRRAAIAERYANGLSSLDAFRVLDVRPDVRHAWHLFVILVNRDVLRIHRDRVIEEVKERGIGTSVHFLPLHTHPYYRERWGYRTGDFPVAEDYAERCLSLPLYPRMTDGDADRVISTLAEVATKFRR